MKTIGTLATETINRDWTNLDRMNTDQIISIMLDENAHMVECLRQQKDIIANVVDRISTQYLCGGRIIYAGAGTSGRMGVLSVRLHLEFPEIQLKELLQVVMMR